VQNWNFEAVDIHSFKLLISKTEFLKLLIKSNFKPLSNFQNWKFEAADQSKFQTMNFFPKLEFWRSHGSSIHPDHKHNYDGCSNVETNRNLTLGDLRVLPWHWVGQILPTDLLNYLGLPTYLLTSSTYLSSCNKLWAYLLIN